MRWHRGRRGMTLRSRCLARRNGPRGRPPRQPSGMNTCHPRPSRSRPQRMNGLRWSRMEPTYRSANCHPWFKFTRQRGRVFKAQHREQCQVLQDLAYHLPGSRHLARHRIPRPTNDPAPCALRQSQLKAVTFARRLQAIAKALGVTIDPQSFSHLSLRGKLAGVTVHEIVNRLIAVAEKLHVAVIVDRPAIQVERRRGGNSSRDQTVFCNELDRLTSRPLHGHL